MFQILNPIWEIIVNLLEVFLFYLLINHKLMATTTLTHYKMKHYTYLGIQIFLLSILNLVNARTIVTIIFMLCTNIFFCIVFYGNSFIVKIFWGSIYSVICLCSEQITMLIPYTFAHINVREVLAGGRLRIPMSLIYIALIAVFVFILLNINSEDISLSVVQKFTYITLSILGIAVAHYILIITVDSAEGYHLSDITDRLATINFVFLILFLALLLFIYQLGVSKKQNTQLLEQTKQQELEQKQLQHFIESTKTLHEIKHDMENHLNVIETLAADGNMTELTQYVKQYRHHLKNAHHLLTTGNTAIDCIVSNKLLYAEQLNISVSHSLLLPEPFPLDDVSLCSLIGNILDNAIEACQRYKSESNNPAPWINFYIKPYQKMILIHVENSSTGQYKLKNNGSLATTKNRAGHGIGITRIQNIVMGAEGILKITPEPQRFVIHIMLPMKELIENGD